MIETILQGLICDKHERTLRAEVLGDVAAPGWCAPGDAGQVGADGAARRGQKWLVTWRFSIGSYSFAKCFNRARW